LHAISTDRLDWEPGLMHEASLIPARQLWFRTCG
jgi:hypothetical protein